MLAIYVCRHTACMEKHNLLVYFVSVQGVQPPLARGILFGGYGINREIYTSSLLHSYSTSSFM